MDYYYRKDLKFPYKFIMGASNEHITNKQQKEVLEWIRENCGSYNKDHIYWGLKNRIAEYPGVRIFDPEIQFKTEEYAAVFKLRWC